MISVVIPAYNAEKFIHQTIDSVLSQTYTDYEIIVIDDGSADNTGDVVKAYGDKVRYIYQKNAGDGPARNAGIKAARGEWVAFLDHDDEWLPEKLERQAKFVAAHPEIQWCATSYYQVHGTQRAIIGNSEAFKKLVSLGSFCYFDGVRITGIHLVMTSTMMIRKAVFDLAGMYESGWLRCADMDMWWRIAYLYPHIGFIDEPLSIMHLDLQSGLNMQLAFKEAGGKDARRLVSKHLILAQKAGCEELFRPVAASVIRRILQTTLFNGLKEDARETMRLFPKMFKWYECIGAYILSTAPRLTSAVMRGISAVKHFLRLNKELTRRYGHKQIIDAHRTVK